MNTHKASIDHVPLVGPQSALVRTLTEAYWGEMDTVSDYAASSTNRDGIGARMIASSVRSAVACALDHAQRLAIRIKQLHAPVPDSDDFSRRQFRVRSPADPLDNESVLTGVIEAQAAAVDRYREIEDAAADALDWITQDLTLELIREKETHERLLQDHLTDLEKLRWLAQGPGSPARDNPVAGAHDGRLAGAAGSGDQPPVVADHLVSATTGTPSRIYRARSGLLGSPSLQRPSIQHESPSRSRSGPPGTRCIGSITRSADTSE